MHSNILRASLLAALLTCAGCGSSPAKPSGEELELEPAKLDFEEHEGSATQPADQPLTSRPPPPSGPIEAVPPEESDTIRKVLSMIESSYARRERQRPHLRVAFAKGSGCAAGSMVVSKTIPLTLRWGIFSEAGKSFPLWARFSNGNGGLALIDTAHDTRGMAIKLLGIVGQKLLEDSEKSTQDFLFQNSPTFMAKDVAGFYGLFVQAQRRPPAFEPGAAFWGRESAIGNPLRERYFSAVPFKSGDTAVKFQVVPIDCKSGKPLAGGNALGNAKGQNFLREEMGKTLASGRSCFSLEAQVWKDPMSTPIEDASIQWSTPFQRVAWIILEKADAKTFAKNSAECEKMSFSPWHGIFEQQPLGGINRLRKESYALSARIRRKMNYYSEKEPPSP